VHGPHRVAHPRRSARLRCRGVWRLGRRTRRRVAAPVLGCGESPGRLRADPGPLHPVSGRRRTAVPDPLDRWETSCAGTCRTTLVLAGRVAAAAGRPGPHLHGRRRSPGLERQDPLGVRAPSAKGHGGGEVLVEGRRLDGPGRFEARFSAIGYAGQEGAPSYASIIDVPRPGCWRLTLSTGKLKADVDVRAENGAA
jgi:hypothetical protein